MKYAIVILGGAADEPQPGLDGRTPLEAAEAPSLARLAEVGRLGQVLFFQQDDKPTVPPGPDAALLSLLGYRPERWYPGHAPLHALGAGVALSVDDCCFELSLLSVIDGVAQPAAALNIPGGEAEALICGLLPHLDLPGVAVHPGQSMRLGLPAHLLIDPGSGNSGRDWSEVVTQRPDDIAGQPLRKVLPVGGTAGERLQQFIAASHHHLADHELNRARAEMGEPAVTHLWPWGQGTLSVGDRPIKPWAERFGMNAVVISRDPAVRGVARLVGLDAISPRDNGSPGGFAEFSNDLTGEVAQLGAVAVESMRDYELTIVHANAAQLASYEGGPREKVSAVDRVSGYTLDAVMRAFVDYNGPYRLLATPLHSTRLETGRESAAAVPFLIAGHKISSVVARPMTEPAAAEADLQVPFGHELMEFFLLGGVR